MSAYFLTSEGKTKLTTDDTDDTDGKDFRFQISDFKMGTIHMKMSFAGLRGTIDRSGVRAWGVLFSILIICNRGWCQLAAPAPVPAPASAASLPVTKLVLYSSGVGYFQRDGTVEGKSNIELRFKTQDINDLLKSMVLQDFNGGRVQTVTYDSQDPLDRRMRSFALDLTSNPTQEQLLNQLRGERVEVLWPNAVTGTVVGVEKRTKDAGENKVVTLEFLNLMTGDGLESIPMEQIKRLRLLNDKLNAEFNQALETLASGKNNQKRAVGIQFDGDGKRKVRVAYVQQTPVWKTSYRLVLAEKETPYLQGWAIVENTSDEDWSGIQLALVSGRPILFVMDLYQPLYSTRPVVQQELYSSLRPQVYGDSLEEKPAAALAAQEARGFGGAMLGRSLAAPAAAAPMRMQKSALGMQAENLERKDAYFKLEDGVSAGAQGAATGELFQYTIKTPVTLARQHSAMLPIVGENIQGEKLSIYNENVQAKHPLNGFRLKNSTALHLLQGPITVFEDGAYAGDARIEDLAPGTERLISYGIDLKTEVEPQARGGKQDLLTVKLKKGTMSIVRKLREERAYNVRNRDQKSKTVLIEHPFRADWKLVEPKESSERTRDFYRFAVKVDASGKASMNVQEERQTTETVEITNLDSNTIAYYIRAPQVSARVKEALQKAAQIQNRISQTAADRSRHEQRTQEITQEQSRLRENMARLSQTSELYTRYVKKLDQQEGELETLRQEIEKLKDTEGSQRKELNDYLVGLDVE